MNTHLLSLYLHYNDLTLYFLIFDPRPPFFLFFFFNDPAPPEIYPLPLHDALPILAWLLARVEFSGRRVVRALVTVPLVLPPVVGGVALLLVFGRRGLLGGWLDSTFGITLPLDRKSTRLNSSHDQISYAVFCLKKKK